MTFITDNVKVTPDLDPKISYQSFTFGPLLHTGYWVTSSGGWIQPQFKIAFSPSGSVSHSITDDVPCK